MAVPFDVSHGRVSGPAVPVIDQVEVTFNGLVRAAVSRSGSLIYASGAGVSQVVLADTLGHVRVLVQEPGNYGSPRLSPDGKRLALTISSTIGTRSDIWIYDIASATLTKLTSDGEVNLRPEWSPDGKRVIYGSNRGGRAALWQQNADLSGAAELIQAAPELINGGVVSPDGRALVYWQSTPGIRTRTSDIFYRALVGDTTSKPIAATSAAAETSPRFSPDGKWVAYTSNQDGTWQVYVQPFPPSGARYQVTTAGGMAPVWSRNGGPIFYVSNSRLNAATVRTSPAFEVQTRTTVLEGNYLLNMPPHANYDVSSDGKSFVLLRPVGQNNEIVVVHGWKYELRERTSGRPGR
jgi:Tol biopolymer transport system component